MQFTWPPKVGTPVQSIIFDLGAVILNIDYQLTKIAFEKLGIDHFDKLFSKATQSSLFDRFEKGGLGEAAFRDELNTTAGTTLTDEQIDGAWNSMLLNLPENRLKLLEQLSKTYPLFLLSNTNSIHIRAFTAYIDKAYGMDRFSKNFKKIYFSNEIGMRKPDAEIFLHVINEQGLTPSATLFIDDSPQHIEGAKKCGINAYHLRSEQDICDLFGFENIRV